MRSSALISSASRRKRSLTVLDAHPDVFGHNIETVRRLHEHAGAKASYDNALWLLPGVNEVAGYDVMTKSGSSSASARERRVVETMRDLRAHGVDVVTIGQYLQPSSEDAKIDRWVHPDEFRWFREQGEALGFGSVFSGPLVRFVRYRAEEQRHAARRAAARSRTRAAADSPGGDQCGPAPRIIIRALRHQGLSHDVLVCRRRASGLPRKSVHAAYALPFEPSATWE